MSVTEFIRRCLDAGMPVEMALTAAKAFEDQLPQYSPRGPLNDAERAKRYRARKRHAAVTDRDDAEDAVTIGVTDRVAESPPVPSVSPTPPSTTLSLESPLLRPLKGAPGSRDDDLFAMHGEASGEPETKSPKAKRHKGLNGHAEDFERWYAEYPRKTSRGDAEKAFLKAIKLATVDQLVAGARAYVAHIASKPPDEQRFVKHPATWLNAKGWLDEHPVPTLNPGGHDDRTDQFSPAHQRRLDNLRRAFTAAPVAAVRGRS